MASDIFLNIGTNRLIVNVYSITGNQSKDLNNRLDLAVMNSLFKDLPPLENESREAYDKRHSAWREARAKSAREEKINPPTTKKKKAATDEVAEAAKVDEEETLLAFIKSSLNLTKYDDQMDYLIDCVKAIAETFGQTNKVNAAALMNEPLFEINNFVAKVCKYARIDKGISEMVLPDHDPF